MPQPDTERAQAEAAAAEAGAIGGRVPRDEEVDEATRPLAEAGQGEAEGFEQAERDLIEHAGHGDQHAARRAIQDAPDESDDDLAAQGGDADAERSTELEQDTP